MTKATRKRSHTEPTHNITREHSKDHDDETETRCQTFVRVFVYWTKRFITFLFSHIGLTCLIVAYAIVGGFLFKAIELPEEMLTKGLVAETKERYIEKITNYYESADTKYVLNKNNWNKEINKLLREYEVEIHKFTKERDWDGLFEGDDYQWSFAESLLYSVTVITTIGYGNITPKTIWGRIMTILYGSIGIPLTMLCLSNIGNVMAGMFRMIYRCACVNMTYQYVKLQRRRLRQRFVIRLQRKAHGMKEWAKRNHSIVSSVLHHRSSTESVNEGSLKKEWLGKADCNTGADGTSDVDTMSFEASRRHSDSVVHKLKKPALTSCSNERKLSLCVKSLQSQNKSLSHHVFVHDLTVIPEDESVDVEVTRDDLDTHYEQVGNENNSGGSTATSSLSLGDFDDDERILKTRLKATRDMVPISMCLLLVAGYIIAGAIIFTRWENWNFLVGVYFCFTTLTTIGFGDFVPGMGHMDDDERSVYCAIYLLFGMALLAMSFHLIQEEVIHKFRKLAMRIGLIEVKITQMLDNYTTEEE